jgi:hypothetical protein
MILESNSNAHLLWFFLLIYLLFKNSLGRELILGVGAKD